MVGLDYDVRFIPHPLQLTDVCASCGASLGGFPFCGACGARNGVVSTPAEPPITGAAAAIAQAVRDEATSVGADQFLTAAATAKALGRGLDAVTQSRALQSLARLQRLLVDLESLSAAEQAMAGELRARLEVRAAWARDALGTETGLVSTATPYRADATTGSVAAAPRRPAVQVDGAQVLASAGVILLVAATLLFEHGKHSFMIVAPSLALMALLAFLTMWCRRRATLAPAGVIFRTATALVLPLVIENTIAAMGWQSVSTNRNLTIAIGALACTVVYGGLARSLHSRGFLVLSYAAAASTWTSLMSLVPLHSWRPISLALLATVYLAASRIEWWSDQGKSEEALPRVPMLRTWPLGLIFHVVTVLVTAGSFERGAGGLPVGIVTMALLALAYLSFAWRTLDQWACFAAVASASLATFLLGQWLVDFHTGVIVGAGAATVVALGIVVILRPITRGENVVTLLTIPLVLAGLSATSVLQPSWVGVAMLASVTVVAVVTTRLGDDPTAPLSTVGAVLAELFGADALFVGVWGVLVLTHHATVVSHAPTVAMIAAGTVSAVSLVRAWWTPSRYSVARVSVAYVPALLSLLLTVAVSIGYVHLARSMVRAELAAGIMTAYALAVWYTSARVRVVWLVFASAALLSGAEVTLLWAHGPIVWLPSSSLAVGIAAAAVLYVSKREQTPILSALFWGLALFVLAPLLLSEYRQYQSVLSVSSAYAVLVVSALYAALVWYAAHRLHARWAVLFSGALASFGLTAVFSAYGGPSWLTPVTVAVVIAGAVLYVAYVMRWLTLVLLAGALLTYGASIVLHFEVGATWSPMATLVVAGLFYGLRALSSVDGITVQWIPDWLDGSGRFSLASWRQAAAATQVLLVNGGLLWSGVLLHRDGYRGAILTSGFIIIATAPRLRLARARWTLLDNVLIPLSLSGLAPVAAVLAHQHNLQYFNLVPAGTLLALSVTLIDRDLGAAHATVLSVARLTSVLALVILFGTTLSQAFGRPAHSVYLLWLMVESVIVLLVGVRTRTRVSALVGSAAVIVSVLLTLARSGGQIGGYVTAVVLAVVLLFVALSQIAKRGEGSIGERTREVWALWR